MRIVMLALATVIGACGVGAADEPEKIAIGMSPTLTSDLSVAQEKFLNGEFPALVKEYTGLAGHLVKARGAGELGEDMTMGKTQFGVFQGIEFAEVQAKNPLLQPLILSIYRTPVIKAIVVVKKDGGTQSVADLRGAEVAILKDNKEHIRRFAVKVAGGDLLKYFGKIVDPPNAEAALDAVLLGKVQAAIVDNATLEIYRDVNPGRFQRLKKIDESIPFPPNVIAYVPQKTGAALAKQFKDGMIAANKSARGRDAMGTFKITAFEPIPDGFEKSLTSVREAFAK